MQRVDIVKALVGKKIAAITISNMGHYQFWTTEPREQILFIANPHTLFDQDGKYFDTENVTCRFGGKK